MRYWRYCLDLVDARFERRRATTCRRDLVRIYLEGDRVSTRDEMAGLVYAQLTAGHETTSSLLGGGLKELLDAARPLGGRCCADPTLIPTRGRGAAAARHAGLRLEAA